MSIGYVGALRLLHRVFSHYPPAHRLHILIRFLTCPFIRTTGLIPPGARAVEIGAGHGIYATLLVHEGVREVIAVEPDLRKTLLPNRDRRIRWIGAFDEALRGEFDAVVVYDATYRMPVEEQRALFRRCFARLRPGGLFIFKDLDPDHPFKMKWARFQEWLSDRFLHVSMGRGFNYQGRAEVERTFAEIGFERFEARPVDRGYPHSHIIYTARRPLNP
jgi:SAM-dependent methyltransferase